MKIYIAAPFQLKDLAVAIMHDMEREGHEVTSRWLKDSEDPLAISEYPVYADKSLADVARADVLLAVNMEGWENKGTGGRHVEFGYALALGLRIILVGPRSNVFHHLEHVQKAESWRDGL